MVSFSFGPRGPDLDGLAEFVRRGDRLQALFFVGRDTEIGHIESTCTTALDLARKGVGPQGATQLLRGAPGAGKTAILSELARRWEAEGGESPVVVSLEPSDLEDPAKVAASISEAVRKGSAADWRTEETSSVGGAVGLGGTGVDGRTERTVYPEAADLAALARSIPGREWTRPVCLMVDEIQTVRPQAHPTLLALHAANHGLPVVPVYAGLGDANDMLVAAGLTRLESEATHDIGALDAKEAKEAVDTMLREFRVDQKGERVHWPGIIAAVSEGWPQHLHNGMRALAEQLVARGGRLADVDAVMVREREERFRTASYRRRRSEEIRDARFLVAELMRQVPAEGAEGSDIKDLVRNLARPLDDPEGDGWSLPKNRDEEWFLKHLVHQGALQLNENDLYSCPIPSFRSYLMEMGGLARPLPEPSGKEPADRKRDRGISIEIS